MELRSNGSAAPCSSQKLVEILRFGSSEYIETQKAGALQ